MNDDPDVLRRISRAIGNLMRVASSDRVHAVRQQEAGFDLSRTEMRFLTIVSELGPLPVTELGAVLHLSQPTASRTLRRLEDEGLVQRSGDATDGRVARFAITPAGSMVWHKFEAAMAGQLAVSLDGMSPERRRMLADLLEEMVDGAHRGSITAR